MIVKAHVFPPEIETVERLEAAEKVMSMRRVHTLAVGWTEGERRQYRNAFESLAHEFDKAARFLRTLEPRDVPEVFTEGTEKPLDSPAASRPQPKTSEFLRAAKDAQVHD